jgi:hypothetical protein
MNWKALFVWDLRPFLAGCQGVARNRALDALELDRPEGLEVWFLLLPCWHGGATGGAPLFPWRVLVAT